MAVVVNVLHFKEPVDQSFFARATDELVPKMREINGFESLHVVQSSETTVVLMIHADSVEALDRVATEVGSPWMAANVVPLLASPPERHIGRVIAASDSSDS